MFMFTPALPVDVYSMHSSEMKKDHPMACLILVVTYCHMQIANIILVKKPHKCNIVPPVNQIKRPHSDQYDQHFFKPEITVEIPTLTIFICLITKGMR